MRCCWSPELAERRRRTNIVTTTTMVRLGCGRASVATLAVYVGRRRDIADKFWH
jgi:hypothetical protein